ncbi:MAG: TerB family tellurite resistance protein [Gammaproteobacteria bacterium]
MYTLENLLASFALAGLLLSAVITYLKINKIWSRKHHREVAESISITAALLSLFTTLPFLVKFLVVDKDFVAAGRFMLSLAGFFVFFLVGIGLWVARDERRNLWSLLMRSLNMERTEMGYLVRSLTSPREARPVLRLLQALACADDELDPRERDIVEQVARSLGVEPDSILNTEAPDLEAGRAAFGDFLDLNPAQERVAKVLDLARMLVRVDKVISSEEKTLLAEIEMMARARKQGLEPRWEVLLVPQDPEEQALIKSRLPDAEPVRRGGGTVYVASAFHSDGFARAACEPWRKLDIFATVEPTGAPPSQLP